MLGQSTGWNKGLSNNISVLYFSNRNFSGILMFAALKTVLGIAIQVTPVLDTIVGIQALIATEARKAMLASIAVGAGAATFLVAVLGLVVASNYWPVWVGLMVTGALVFGVAFYVLREIKQRIDELRALLQGKALLKAGQVAVETTAQAVQVVKDKGTALLEHGRGWFARRKGKAEKDAG